MMLGVEEEDEIQRRELERLLKTCKDPVRRANLEQSLGEIGKPASDGNDTILTADFGQGHGLTSVGSAKNLLSGINMNAGKSTPLARPGSASVNRQRRPSITLDKIPESVNEHRPDSNYSRILENAIEDSMDVSPRRGNTSNTSKIDFKNGSGSPSSGGAQSYQQFSRSMKERILNLNQFDSNRDCSSIITSCYHTSLVLPDTAYRGDKLGSLSPGTSNQNSLIRWVCTGLCPQIMILPLNNAVRIRRALIECYGDVESMSISTIHTEKSSRATSLDCIRLYDSGFSASGSKFEVELSDDRNDPSGICNQVSIIISKAADSFFGIHRLTIFATDAT